MSYRFMPRRRRCLAILASVCIVYLLFFLQYSLKHRLPTLSGFRSIMGVEVDDPDRLLDELEDKLSYVKLSRDYNRYWKYYTDLHDYKLLLNPHHYKELRESEHFYDPRVTFAVYVHYIRKQLERNSESGPVEPVAVPFSWQDWIDLSALNPYLDYKEEDKPTCVDILSHGLEYVPSLKGKTSRDSHKNGMDLHLACTDNSDYKGPTDKKLLPGFNFYGYSFPSWFQEKKLHAKSLILSYLPLPSSLVFLSKDGIYETSLTEDATMLSSGLFDQFVDDALGEEKNKVLIDPIKEYLDLQETRHATRAGPDFNSLLTPETDYQYNIPMDDFYYDFNGIIANLSSRRESLTTKELKHLESLENSRSMEEKELKKGFNEVNLFWPQHFNGHKLREDGGHYDYRFFDGFLSESRVNIHDDPNEKRKLILHRMIHTWLQFTYRTGLVSILAHGSLLSWWWDGLVFEWDDDIDVQMPIMELDRFCAAYNGSLIVEDAQFGFHKYLVGCSDSITHRGKGNGLNNIDARFIDVDSGMYIDITGLAISGTASIPIKFRRMWKVLKGTPDKFQDPGYEFQKNGRSHASLVKRASHRTEALRNSQIRAGRIQRVRIELETKEAFERNRRLHIVNCRNNHFYSYEELSPVRLSAMEGAPVFIPNEYGDVLTSEYSNGLKSRAHSNHFYDSDLRFWVPMQKIRSTISSEANTNVQYKLLEYIANHRLESLVSLLEDEEVMKEFYLTHGNTKAHKKEVDLSDKKGLGVITDEEEQEYYDLLDTYKKYNKPMRKDYHNYMAEIQVLGNNGELQLENELASGNESDGFYSPRR
ncbi:DEKNAAC102551 [Brettanomyces naardenensis]|uniref:DEKNAAC102551 n=1 Tax=Brettanomyces naardenensis TaxID=13370 RepID=A0A448YKT8_BRENA|nr:DEKNAAC102551 [Brettanomyces naardenensis]